MTEEIKEVRSYLAGKYSVTPDVDGVDFYVNEGGGTVPLHYATLYLDMECVPINSRDWPRIKEAVDMAFESLVQLESDRDEYVIRCNDGDYMVSYPGENGAHEWGTSLSQARLIPSKEIAESFKYLIEQKGIPCQALRTADLKREDPQPNPADLTWLGYGNPVDKYLAQTTLPNLTILEYTAQKTTFGVWKATEMKVVAAEASYHDLGEYGSAASAQIACQRRSAQQNKYDGFIKSLKTAAKMESCLR